MARVIATPAEGLRIRKPDGSVLNPAGEPVERDSFWLRRQRDGDVKLSDLPAVPAAESATELATADAAKTTRKGA